MSLRPRRLLLAIALDLAALALGGAALARIARHPRNRAGEVALVEGYLEVGDAARARAVARRAGLSAPRVPRR